MTKAYKALTDEEIRNNYLQYGHPDGKQSFSMGIALPKIIVQEGSGKFVLLFYGILLGVLLPYAVGKWWYGTQALTKEKVLVASAGKLFREYKEDMSEGGVLGAISTGSEYQEVLKGGKAIAGLATVEKAVTAQNLLSESEGRQLKDVEDRVRRKALSLLWAYLARLDLDDPTLRDEKYEVAPVAFRLNDSLTSISLAFGAVAPLLATLHTSQNLIQAVSPHSSPLLQLPYITPGMANAMQAPGTRSPLTVRKFMALPETARRKLCSDLSDAEYSSALQVARQMPYLDVAKAFFKVQGDRVITPSSLVQLVVKGRFVPPGSRNVPEVDEIDLEDIDPDEDDLEALLGRKPARNAKRKTVDGGTHKEVLENGKTKSIQPPLAHAPYFARDHSPRWHVFLADAKQGRIAVPPFTFTGFEKPVFDSEGKPTFNMQTLKCQFQAPPQVGEFQFVMHVICDSYIGLDTKMDIVLSVQDVSKAVVVESDDEISEPDEGVLSPCDCVLSLVWTNMEHPDTLAGQMQALKSGGISGQPPKKKKVKREVKEESSDDESDTDGEVDDDTSETDTETDTDG